MENKKNRILVADDDKEIREILIRLLTDEGYEVIAAQDGREALEKADETIDLYLLDVSMPFVSGFSAGTQIRRRFMAPIIFLTAYTEESDRMLGFSAGADDYIPKPFSNTELLIRIKSLLRRVQQYSSDTGNAKEEKRSEPGEIIFKDLTLNQNRQCVTKDGKLIAFTYTEFKILELFVTHPGQLFSLDHIYQSVWKEQAVGDETIMVHIKNIRKKLGDSSRHPKYIKTAWGKGYYAE
nr:response regulator transcription factor [uncultured Acetatifactor sp.]